MTFSAPMSNFRTFQDQWEHCQTAYALESSQAFKNPNPNKTQKKLIKPSQQY